MYLNKFVFLFSFLFSFLIVFPCFASAPFGDTFESYSAGSINGQGSWVSSSTGCQISSDHVSEGTNSVACAVNQIASKKQVGSPITAGEWYFDLWLHPNQTTTTPLYVVNPYQGTTSKSFFIFCGKSPTDDYLTLRSGNCAGSVLLDNITTDSFHRYGIRWDGTYMNVNVDGGAWSANVSKSTTGIDGLSFGGDQGYSVNYFDNLSGLYDPVVNDSSVEFTHPVLDATTTVDYYSFDWAVDTADFYTGYDSAAVYVCGGNYSECSTFCGGFGLPWVGIPDDAECWVDHKVVSLCDGVNGLSSGSGTINLGNFFSEGQPVYAIGYLLVADGSGYGSCSYDLTDLVTGTTTAAQTSVWYNINTFNDSLESVGSYCDVNFPNEIPNAICTALYNIFIPSITDDALSRANTEISDKLAEKVPFAYFQDYSNVVSTLGNGTAATTSMGIINVPVTVAASGGFSGASSSGFDMGLPSLADVDTVAAAVDDWDLMFSYIIWLILFTWLGFRGFSVFRPA
jgi:hypothetical protein